MDWKVIFNSTLLITAAVYGVLLAIALAAGLFGFWLLVMLTLSAWRYSYTLLRYVAQGKSHIPPPDIDSMNPVGELMLVWHFVAFPVVLALIATLRPFGTSGLGTMLNLLVAAPLILAFPASAALMGFTRNIVEALNPLAIRAVIASMGRDYFVLVGVCVGLVLLMAGARQLILASHILFAGVPIAILQAWVWLASFALIGSSIHEHAHSIEIPGASKSPDERAATTRIAHWRSELDRAYASIRSGLLPEGFETIRRLVDENGRSREIQFWVFEQMIRWDDRTHALHIARRLIEQLLSENDVASAFELFVRCRRIGDVGLADTARQRLAAFASENGQTAIAGELSGSAP